MDLLRINEEASRYEYLRRLLADLEARLDVVDDELVQLKQRLPIIYTYTGDEPLKPEQSASGVAVGRPATY